MRLSYAPTVQSRLGRGARVGVIVVILAVSGVFALVMGPAFGSTASSPRAARTTTTTPHGKKKKAKRKKRSTPTSRVSTKASLDKYCASVATGGYAEVTLFDNAMRPLLTQAVTDSTLHTTDPSLAGNATALLNSITASLSTTSLAQVPAEIRTDVQAVRTEKQAILQNLVNAANGDASGVQFLVQASSTGGGVQQQLVNIGTYLQANCPAADRPPTTPSS
jgi:hypothetical protein